jgi:hypothetical protein
MEGAVLQRKGDPKPRAKGECGEKGGDDSWSRQEIWYGFKPPRDGMESLPKGNTGNGCCCRCLC